MTITETDAVEDLLRAALARLDRQERRTTELESALHQLAPPTVLLRPAAAATAAVSDTPTHAALDTPPAVPRPSPRTTPRERPPPPRPTGPMAVPPLDVLASLDQVVWSVSPDGGYVFLMVGATERTYGRSADHFLDGQGRWVEAVHPDDRAMVRAALRQVASTDGFALEHRVCTPVGTVRWVASRGRLVRTPDGKPVRIDGTTTDVTARTGTDRTGLAVLEAIGPATGTDFLARAVEQLATAYGFRAAVVAVPDPENPACANAVAAWIDGRAAGPFAFPATGAFVRDVLAGGAQYVPAAARDRFPADDFLARLRADAVVAQPLTDAAGTLLGFVAVLDDAALKPGAADVRPALRALAPRLAAELSRPAAPGRRPDDFDARLAAAEARAAAAEATTREADEQLRQARRLETVGRLVAGVAHDFNNLLTVISGSAELVRDLLDPADPLRDPAELIAATAHTAAGVARQLVAFGKPGGANPCPVDASAAVRAVERMLRRLIGEGVVLDVAVAPGLSPVRVDPGQFDQVVLNLVANARDAIAAAGTVTVRTAETTTAPDRPGWPADLPAGEYVALTVTDTGCGMTEAVRARMFDPYFTTKGENGSGIGLATVRDIVRAAGGHVEVESTPGWGTSVRVFWPKAEGMAALPAHCDPPVIPSARGETVLLVQDGDRVRDVAAVALQLAGYRVLEAGDGDAGEERARLYAGTIDLLVTDLGLPKRGGPDLADAVRAARPGVKVLFASGYTPPSGVGGTFVAKPYTANELLDAVRKALDTS